MYLIHMTCPECRANYTVESTVPKDERIDHCPGVKNDKKTKLTFHKTSGRRAIINKTKKRTKK
jgi:hypothetical protein